MSLSPRLYAAVTRGPYQMPVQVPPPVDGALYFCTTAERWTIVDGLIEQDGVTWIGCHACQRMEFEDGRVLECEKQWHAAMEITQVRAAIAKAQVPS